jgi:hypothetical protein
MFRISPLNRVRSLVIAGLASLWLLTALPAAGLAADAPATATDRDQVLVNLGYQVWQRLNDARVNPQAVIDRLGLSVAQVGEVLGDEAWLIERGLAPLAWDDQLYTAASAHGRDMLDRVYYSHVSPDGSGPYERIAATGYQARLEDETLAALVFSSYLAVETALPAMIDMLLRDELTGVVGEHRNIFSTELSEVGMAFFAESVPLLEGQPYVYLLVLAFAAPLEPRHYIIGAGDPGAILALQSTYTGFWELIEPMPGGAFQISYPVGGALLMALDDQWTQTASARVYEAYPSRNHFVDLRGLPAD